MLKYLVIPFLFVDCLAMERCTWRKSETLSRSSMNVERI